MNFASIGSMSNFTRAMKMKTQWKMKQDSKDYTKKQDAANASGTASESQKQIDSVRKQLDQLKENKDDNLETILLKVKCGRRLTADELSYLSEKSPEEYRKYKEVESQRENYKQELKKCRTKEEVQRLRTIHLGNTLTQLGAIANNPAIPKNKKLELFLQEHAKVNALNDETNKFVESGRYDKLPTDEEREEEIRRKQEEMGGKQPEAEISEDEEKGGASTEITDKEHGDENRTSEQYGEDTYTESTHKDISTEEKATEMPKKSYNQASTVYRDMMSSSEGPVEEKSVKSRRFKKMA